MTIVYLLVFLPYAIVKGIKLVNKTDPEVTFNEVFHDIDAMGAINADDLYLNFGYTFLGDQIIDETVLMPFATPFEFKNGTITLLENQYVAVVNCTTKFMSVSEAEKIRIS